MAFVILSTRSVASSQPRSVSLRALVAMLTGGVIVLLGAGAAIGYGVSRAVPVVTAPEPPTVVVREVSLESRMLIDRLGELNGRMSQLETEARDLATRVGILSEIGERASAVDAAPAGRLARTPPGKPAGGPLLKPEPEGSPGPAAELGAEVDAELGLTDIEGGVERLAELMRELDQTVVEMNLAHMARPGREPVRGRAAISSFGNRVDPITRKRAFHSGIDYPAPTGTPIHASAGGRVIFAGYRANYGRTVEIDHGGGVVTRYAHASAVLVKVDQVVMPGEQIARVGSTGRSTGPHLHFEILRDGRFVDPRVFLAQFREM